LDSWSVEARINKQTSQKEHNILTREAPSKERNDNFEEHHGEVWFHDEFF
jgi:hypothetical protein